MTKKLMILPAILLSSLTYAQQAEGRIAQAYNRFESDSAVRNAAFSLYIVDAETGAPVLSKNSTLGLAPASTQKIITAATALDQLGADFRYRTTLGYRGTVVNKTLNGNIVIIPSGDPTLGSWRWQVTRDSNLLNRWYWAIRKMGIDKFGAIEIDEQGWTGERIPDGWIWQDIGNYYGAGASAFNWHENQFDIILRSGKKLGDTVSIVQTSPSGIRLPLLSNLLSAAKGTGDNAYVYYPLGKPYGILRGTIPVEENNFTISAAEPDPPSHFVSLLKAKLLSAAGIRSVRLDPKDAPLDTIFVEESPRLDSIIYWFLKKSINLYGEALLKTMARQKGGKASAEAGVDLIKRFWQDKGILPSELRMVDGSGLSPLNRVTTHAQVTVLQYARKQPWFRAYLDAFPEYNGMKMKSGTINGAKGFCGYHTSKEGKSYIFSFIVNNYSGPASTIVQKMYKVLDELK